MYTEIKPGESLIVTCGACDREFKITYEPKAEDMTAREKLSIDRAALRYCPFCSHFGDNFHVEQT